MGLFTSATQLIPTIFRLDRIKRVNLLKTSILLLAISILSGCANNMVLYKEDIQEFDFSSPDFPATTNCRTIMNAYKAGTAIMIKRGLRWVSPQKGDGYNRYKCDSFDSISCENTVGRVTNLTEREEGIVNACKRDIRQAKTVGLAKINRQRREDKKILEEKEKALLVKQKRIRLEKQRDVTSTEISTRLKSIEFKGVKPVKAALNFNMYGLAEGIISSVDVNDFIGLVVLGSSENPYAIGEQTNSYSVLQVTNDRVYLTCGDDCGLPIIGIVRVNQRPSPIERVEYNDNRGVYMFLGTEHFYSKRDRLGNVSSQVQALLFHRITMKDLGLPNDFFDKTHSDLTSVD